jgi:hypothetical protein
VVAATLLRSIEPVFYPAGAGYGHRSAIRETVRKGERDQVTILPAVLAYAIG